MMLAAGMFIFVSFLLVLHLSLIYAGVKLDSSIMNFYPMMAGAGILFGFERWWAYEQGGVNPFHDTN